MAKTDIEVSVEQVVHSAFRELAQSVWDKHGICVNDVSFSWIDVSTTAGDSLMLNVVEASTRTKA